MCSCIFPLGYSSSQDPLTVPIRLSDDLLGHLMNWDYRRTARDHNIVIDKVAGDDMSRYPIEKARYRSICYPVVISSAGIAGYGWSIHAHTVSQVIPRRIKC